MEFYGPAAYENNNFFQNYLRRRNRKESPNNAIEKPIIFELIKDIKNKHILDLGCGDGRFGIELIEEGCQTFRGIDGSLNMIEEASNNLNGTNSILENKRLEEWRSDGKKYDIIVSRMVLHYIETLPLLSNEINRAMKKDGMFVFSVQHPTLTASTKSANENTQRTDWVVDDYFLRGKREETWMGKKVIKFHRPFEDYFQMLCKNWF
ncbi:class I SAM-dependent DNA methyltransferase [Halobacillus campisalis]|uniref:Class I SAM-dependent DNA methyltransferase n=1 Tax=Halobacillus campisalis TaxID=435909 RepID=A0ABW2K0E3_9BACI|nr:class I SAM-dependent methyltransferase [Halobacillus campisalis]